MACKVPGLIRFLLPNRLVARYMESKIPLPTDNIYKFYALFSLLLLIFSLGAFLYVQQSANEQVIAILPELEVLKEAKELSINPAIKYTKSCCVGDTWMPEIRTDSLRA